MADKRSYKVKPTRVKREREREREREGTAGTASPSRIRTSAVPNRVTSAVAHCVARVLGARAVADVAGQCHVALVTS